MKESMCPGCILPALFLLSMHAAVQKAVCFVFSSKAWCHFPAGLARHFRAGFGRLFSKVASVTPALDIPVHREGISVMCSIVMLPWLLAANVLR